MVEPEIILAAEYRSPGSSPTAQSTGATTAATQ